MTSNRTSFFTYITLFAGLALFSVPFVTHAQGFVALTSIPGIQEAGNAESISILLNNLYRICIGLAAVIAVLKIIQGGVTYMLGDSITEKKEAKHHITMAILGLVLVLSPYLVFSIIDPRILNLDVDVSKLAPEPPQEVAQVDQRCAGITAGRVINSELRDCCAANNLYPRETRGGSIVCEATPAPSLGSPGDRGKSGDSFYFNVPKVEGPFAILLLQDTPSCIQVKYAVFDDEAQCKARLPQPTPGVITVPIYQCSAQSLSAAGFFRANASKDFCASVQSI